VCKGVWWGNPREKKQLGTPKRGWEDGIKMDLQEVGCGGMDWIELAQDRDNGYNQSSVVTVHVRVSERCSKRR
jgi:hypothetical protein